MSNPIPLSKLVQAYAADGIPAARAVHYIVESRLASQNARGKGYRAGERARKLGQATAASLEALAKRMAKAHRQMQEAARAEAVSEARSHSHHYRLSPHE